MDNKTKNGRIEQHIDINVAYETDYWSARFGVSKDKLKAAIETVGSSVAAITQYLKK